MFKSSVYCYKLKRNRRLCYNEKGWFHCPKETKENRFQHNPIAKGDFQSQLIERREEEREGKIYITKGYMEWKASRKNPPYCKCSEKMVWKGYPVWLEKVIKEGKVIGGMFRMGAEEKKSWHRDFKTKKKQREFIDRFLQKAETTF